MKAVVLEKRFLTAAVLKEDGTFVRTLTAAGIGEEIEIRDASGFAPARKAAVMAVMTAVICLMTFKYMMLDVYAYVTVDVNPSVEFAVNRMERIISVEAVNEDGAEIAEVLNSQLKGTGFETAMEKTKQILTENSYLSEDAEDSILIDIVSSSDQEKEILKEKAETVFDDANDKPVVSFSDETQRDKAKEQGISTGRYRQMTEETDHQVEITDTDDLREDQGKVHGQQNDQGNVPAEAEERKEMSPEERPMTGPEAEKPEN